MLDYDKDSGNAVIMESLCRTLELRLWMSSPTFTHDGSGTITSDVFEAKIQDGLPEWWNGVFPKLRSFKITAEENGGAEEEIVWTIRGGTCVSCIQNDKELVEQSNRASEDDKDENEDLSVDVFGEFSVQFYAKEGAVPDENGKYNGENYIGVVDREWLVVEDEGMFNAVFCEGLPDPDDDDYEDRLDEEQDRIFHEYVTPFVKKGKPICIKQIEFESGNDKTTEEELLSTYRMCQDESEDADNGMRLYKLP